MATSKAILEANLLAQGHRGMVIGHVLWFVLVLTLCVPKFSATLIRVKHKEGTSHGFIVLRSQEGPP